MASFGAPVDFVGRVAAADVARHSAALAASGVTPLLVADDEHPTGTIVVIVQGEQRTMLTEKGANALLTADAVPDTLLDHASIVHFTGYSLFGPGREKAVARLMERAVEREVLISVDPGSAGFIADFGVERFLRAVDGATLVFPNLEEGRLLTGLDDPAEVAAALDFPVVALTMDTAGAVVSTAAGIVRVDALPTTVVDPTGAGDAFAAGFLADWLHSRDATSAAAHGVAAGARAVATTGARPV